MTDLDRAVHDLLDDAIPEPPIQFDPAELRASAGKHDLGEVTASRWAGHRMLAIAASVVVVTGLAAGLSVGLTDSHRPSGSAQAGHHNSAHHGFPQHIGSASHRVATARVVTRLLAQAPAYPGSTKMTTAPNSLLTGGSSIASPNLVQRRSFATAAGTVGSVIAYFNQQLRDGYEPAGATRHLTAAGRSIERDYAITTPTLLNPTVYRDLQLTVTVSPLAAGQVGIRIDATAIWIPRRLAASTLPGTVLGATVRTWRNKSIHRQLSAQDAGRLVALLNALPVPVLPTTEHGCSPFKTTHDVVILHYQAHTARIDAGGACSRLAIYWDGHQMPQVFLAASFRHTLTDMLKTN